MLRVSSRTQEKEYALVTEYLKDIETIGSLPKDESKKHLKKQPKIFLRSIRQEMTI